MLQRASNLRNDSDTGSMSNVPHQQQRQQQQPQSQQDGSLPLMRDMASRPVADLGSVPLPPPPPLQQTAVKDSRLDFLSEDFDALLALFTPGLSPPNPRAVPQDNVYKCRQLLPHDHPDYRAPIDRSQPSKTRLARMLQKTRSTGGAARVVDAVERKPPLQVIAETVHKGPLLLLRRAYEDSLEVRLVTRHARGVRGVAIGTLVGFDRHMNLLLRDVQETYTVLLKVCRVLPPRDAPPSPPQDPPSPPPDPPPAPPAGEGVSSVMTPFHSNEARLGDVRSGERVRWGRKQEVRQRKLKQIFVRGDNVVLVSIVASAAERCSRP